MNRADEFGGIDFAMGSVIGTRAFDVDILGRLKGVSMPQIWTPGENLAKCHKPATSMMQKMMHNMLYGRHFPVLYVGQSNAQAPSVFDFDEDYDPEKEALVENFLGIKSPVIDKTIEEFRRKKEEREKLDLLEDCTHGFYAYYEGSNDYRQHGRINGVIEGYGEVIIGTRGFRAMKAKILALHIPKSVPDHIRKMVQHNYPGIPIFEKFKTMVAEFPSSAEEYTPTPENDPEFWTRAV